MCSIFGWVCSCLCFMISSALILISCDIYVAPHVVLARLFQLLAHVYANESVSYS
uniref:Uncharacterized protein n=1 Tax=Arundo donax TaxID=35708 RepID=A0A0A9EHB9_ARUDO